MKNEKCSGLNKGLVGSTDGQYVAAIEFALGKSVRPDARILAQLLYMREQQGLSYEEISRRACLPIGRVRAWVFIAREKQGYLHNP